MERDSAENQFAPQPRPRVRSREIPARSHTPWYAWLALASLAFNLLTLTALIVVRGMISEALTHANQSLFETMRNIERYEGYIVDVQMSEEVTLDQSTPVLFQDTITVPISRSVSITKSILVREQIIVPINTTIPVNEVVQAPLDIAGSRVFIPVPINLNVPINMDVSVPFESEVPVEFEIPIEFEIDIAINELIPLTDRNGDPLSVKFDATSQVAVPVSEIMHDINMMTTLSDLHQALNVVETVLLLPSPEELPLSVASDSETAQR